MTRSPRQWHHATTNVALAAPSLVGLSSVVASGTQQRCHQRDSVAPSLAVLGNAVARGTQQHHHQQDLAAPSLEWLCSAITSMTRQHYCQHDSSSTSRRSQVTSTAPSPAWLSSTIVSMTQHLHHTAVKSSQQLHRQHDSTTTSRNSLIVNVIDIWVQWQATTRNLEIHDDHILLDYSKTVTEWHSWRSILSSCISHHRLNWMTFLQIILDQPILWRFMTVTNAMPR
jgi:hypothetical protein